MPADTIPSDSTPAETPRSGRLFRHTKRPDWGVAILVWERGGKKAFQFDDGKLRVFTDEYCWLFEAAGDDRSDEGALVADLKESASLNVDRKAVTLEPVYSFDDQIKIFTKIYPLGFEDPAWSKKHRGEVGGSALKRHREPSAYQAQQLLSPASLDVLLAEEKHDEVFETLLRVLASTDLVAAKTVGEIEKFTPEQRAAVATALRDLLHGEGRFTDRFRNWVTSLRLGLGVRPTWRMATSVAALVHPESQVCVRYSTFIRQAAVFMPSAVYSKRPRRRGYGNFKKVAQQLHDRLAASGHTPRDMLDVHDFVWVTLRPSAAKLLLE